MPKLSASGASKPVRKRIREFEIIAGPFSGTYGEVLIGEHSVLKFKRAIKTLHRFVRPALIETEARNQMKVKSLNVVQVFDFYRSPFRIVMEYCPITLSKFLTEKFDSPGGRIRYEEARELLHGVVKGLNDAHGNGIVHGDIKPANILIGETDQFPKLADFGCATAIGGDVPILRGSSNWMAPEVLSGGKPTRESDYFSVGVLAYLILTGRHPFFYGDPSCLRSEEDNIGKSSFRPAPIVDVRDADIDPKVAELVMYLLEREAEVRRPAFEQLMSALARPPEPETSATPAAPTSPVGLSPGEADALEGEYERAKNLFFHQYRPREAVSGLEAFLAGLPWEKFRESGSTRVADCWSLIGYIRSSSGRYAQAIEAASNGLAVDPAHVSSLHVRAYGLVQQGDNEQARRDLEYALTITQEPRKVRQLTRLLSAIETREAVASPATA